jgi:putative membrane protein
VRFLLRVLVNALGLAAAAWLLDGIRVQETERADQAVTVLAVGLVFGIVNAFIAPVIKVLSLPFIILTLGLLLVVINALMLTLTTRIAEGIGLGFEVDGFGNALVGSIIISIVSALLSGLTKD